MNQVFGDCFEVTAAEADDPKAFEENWPKDQFIFDVQTHHVDIAQNGTKPTKAAGRATSSGCFDRAGKTSRTPSSSSTGSTT